MADDEGNDNEGNFDDDVDFDSSTIAQLLSDANSNAGGFFRFNRESLSGMAARDDSKDNGETPVAASLERNSLRPLLLPFSFALALGVVVVIPRIFAELVFEKSAPLLSSTFPNSDEGIVSISPSPPPAVEVVEEEEMESPLLLVYISPR